MVYISRIFAKDFEKKVIRKHFRERFIDSLRVFVRGGTGGNGLPKYGGIGGKGGDVYVLAKEGVALRNVAHKHPSKRVSAGIGGNSHQRRLLGDLGTDKIIEVPVGVTVFDEYGRVLGELDKEGSKVLVARGGPGGTPVVQFTGSRGQAHTIVLDLKLIADVGLVGFPNAGKSTLLKAISNARPKIASYPFTTICPNIGVLNYSDHRQVTMADLPGLIEGAHANVGLGHQFLKHVERTKLLLLVADIGGFQLSPRHPPRSCLDTIVLLNKELELYREDLLDKPSLILINKMDTEGAEGKWDEIKDKLKNLKDVLADLPEEVRPLRALDPSDVIPISARYQPKDMEVVKDRVRQVLDFYYELTKEDMENQLLKKVQSQVSQAGPRML